MIDQLNSRITVLTGEVKLLQSDKETGKYKLQIHLLIKHRTHHNLNRYKANAWQKT